MKKTIIALTAMAAITTPAWAQTSENIFKYRVGGYEVILLSEGQSNGNTRTLIDAPAEIIAKYAPGGTYPTSTNAFLIKSPGETVLIDAGTGRNLADNLKAIGISEGQIDIIYLTHMHGDHIGGLLREGKRAFENSALRLGAVEAGYWAAQGGNAKSVLDIYKPQTIDLYKLEEAPTNRDGIFPIEAFGHTPGHTAFLVVSNGEKLLVWGDITHAMAVQMPHPEISVTYDTDPAMARGSRMKILEYAAENKIPIAGMHIAYPAIGTVEKATEGYRFIPAK